jgi:hypothetical protein
MPTRKTTPGENAADTTLPRRLTRDLTRAVQLAMMMAHSRASEVLEVSDLLAGLYMDDWDRLSRFWKSTDEIEQTMRQLCRISPQRWNYWLEYYSEIRGSERKWWEAMGLAKVSRSKTKPEESLGRFFQFSSDLAAVFKDADEIAPFQDRVGTRTVPIVSSECVLYAIAQNARSTIGRKLLATGLDVTALERAARFPRRPPV